MSEWIGIVHNAPPGFVSGTAIIPGKALTVAAKKPPQVKRKAISMDLVFNPTRKITTGEMYITCDPQLEFVVKVSVTRPTRLLMAGFARGDYTDLALAEQVIEKTFVSVAQNGHSYPLDSKEAVEALRESTGDDFILALAGGFVDNHYSFFTKDTTDSGD